MTTPIIGGPRPLPAHRRAHSCYTFNCEEPEKLTFTDVGKPFLVYEQRTWSPHGNAMHTETGFLRTPGDGTVEFIIAQPTGQSELAEGYVKVAEGCQILELRSQIVNAATAKHVESTERTYRLNGDELLVDFAMSAVGYPMTHHLHSSLHRVDNQDGHRTNP